MFDGHIELTYTIIVQCIQIHSISCTYMKLDLINLEKETEAIVIDFLNYFINSFYFHDNSYDFLAESNKLGVIIIITSSQLRIQETNKNITVGLRASNGPLCVTG